MLQLRPYQLKIVESIGRSNAIVKMPTGSGKTFLAAEIIRKNLNREPLGLASLFLVPTQDLVDQQSRAIQQWCSETTVLRFTGSMGDPREWNNNEKVCLVSTPQAFRTLQNRKPETFGWQAFGLVVFDEVHHVLKDHPYRHIALSIKDFSAHKIQVLGLSASLTYQVRDAAITNDLNRLKYELNLEKMESPSLEELIEGGYVPQHGRYVELESTTEAPEGVIPAADRKPHEMHTRFIDRIEKKEATPFSLLVWTVVRLIEDRVAMSYPDFTSPLSKPKLRKWEDYAYRLGQGRPVTEQALLGILEFWYGALRLLVQSWEEEELLALQWLEMNSAFEFPNSTSISEVALLRARAEDPEMFFKFGRLRHHIREKRKEKGDSFRCIVFVQQRITAVVLSHFINNDVQLSLSDLGIKAGFVTARESVITPRIKVSKSEVRETIQMFRDGQINILVATSVIEEVRASLFCRSLCHLTKLQGFDIPAANVVISYNHLKDSVELCQRFGRARQQESSIVLLEERPDRPLSLLESARTRQDSMIREFDPSTSSFDEGTEKIKQRDRERSAFQAVFLRSRDSSSPVADVRLYTSKTKASLTEDYHRSGRGIKCFFTYRSILRTITVDSEATSKKQARKDCAVLLLQVLKDDTGS